MVNYRRAKVSGGTYFFTVNLLERKYNPILVKHIAILKNSIQKIKQKYPFQIDAWVVLPDHMHCIWTLGENDKDFSTRWRLIKSDFSRTLPNTEYRTQTRLKNNERGIWQRHYWEHLIRNEDDYRKHLNYIHVNPVKHGLVNKVIDWPHSTFHYYVNQGHYSKNWCGDTSIEISGGD